MFSLAALEPIEYLIIGHLTVDRHPSAARLGGSAAYAARTARALGLRVGVVTAWGGEIPLTPLADIPVASFPAEHSTTFENIETPEGRVQILHHVAPRLDYHLIPEAWRTAPLVHLGPVAQEVEPSLARRFPAALVGLTPQGWLRGWDASGRVFPTEWPEATFTLAQAGAAVISVEDVGGDEARIEEMAAACRVLAVTEADQGARLFWHGDVRRYRPPLVQQVDAIGAGDVFAAAFFYRLWMTRDPWEAARFATQLAAFSVTRRGLDSAPTPDEIEQCTVQVF